MTWAASSRKQAADRKVLSTFAAQGAITLLTLTDRCWSFSIMGETTCRQETTMPTASRVFEVERDGPTLIVVPQKDLRELECLEIDTEMKGILNQLEAAPIKNVVLDFHKTDYYGSTALGFFVKLWKRLRERDGRLAFCRVSAHELEILQLTSLDGLWPICPSREEALRAVQKP
jgi:anti-anti-sigma factor